MAARQELFEYNILTEYNALQKMLKYDLDEKSRLYKTARRHILKYIIDCAQNDPNNGNFYNEENIKLVKEAGEMLYKEGGMNSMNDGLVWSFIPDRYTREIDNYWNGIGQWKS